MVKEHAEAAGWEVLVRQTQNPASDAQWLAQNQIKVAFPMVTPTVFLQIVRSPGGSIDQWAGVGITMGLNTVAKTACTANPDFDGAMFFSPVPGLNVIDQVDPEFRKAGGVDDIELLLWGVAKSVHEVFKKMPADDLSRQRFMSTLEHNVLDSRLYPALHHSPSNHMNAQGVHLLFANCDTQQYETPPDGLFRTSF
ncbi:MAG TPA: hypothetical protein VNU01_11640 [Egibacteraceae bacterium]|nr:hypothetical protein [Egibacteraceae bacterium]